MSENQNHLYSSHIRAKPRRRDAEKHDFRHYMAQIAPIFPSETSLGSENPWDGSPDPWDGNQNPRDGATGQPPCAAFPTLKGGARRVSALTVCHIAHKPARPGNSTPTRRLEATLGGTPSWRPTPPGRPTVVKAYRGEATSDRGGRQDGVPPMATSRAESTPRGRRPHRGRTTL